MNELVTMANNTKTGKVIFMLENLLEIGLNHKDGYTTLYLDIQDMPANLRQKIEEGDEDTMEQIEAYLDDYYTEAELDSISLIRGEGWNNLHHWKDIFSCC